MKFYIYLFLIILLLVSSVFSQNVLSLDYLGGNSLIVNLTNEEPVGGFQLDIDGIEITGYEGGTASESGFMVSAGGSIVLGFSMTGATIPAGESPLITLFFDSELIIESPCFKTGNPPGENFPYCELSDSDGERLDVELGLCAEGCFNNLACNFLENNECEFGVTYYQDADGDGNGNPNISQVSCDSSEGWVTNDHDLNDTCSGTISEIDGSCCVSNIFDDCGICDGDDSSCAGCDGIANSGVVEDDCGICNGDDSSCAGCDGIANSGIVEDECGNCGGDCIFDNNGIIVCSGNIPENLVIADCLGECGGDACMGCTDSNADNYDSDSTTDDGSCEYSNSGTEFTISEIIHNCGDEGGESLTCEGQYDLSDVSAVACPSYETQVTTTGTIVDYFDITPFNGPYSFTIQDVDGNQIDFVVWPESSQYQDGFDITTTDLNVLTEEPFGTYDVEITGELGAYCDDDELLDINSEWQVTVEYESDITIISSLSLEDHIKPSSVSIISTHPNPFNPSITIEYSVASVGHVNLQIIGLDGKHVDTITNSIQTQGIYNVQWTPINVSSGMYLIQLRSNDQTQNKKVLYLK